jgi:hypothetical protein
LNEKEMQASKKAVRAEDDEDDDGPRPREEKLQAPHKQQFGKERGLGKQKQSGSPATKFEKEGHGKSDGSGKQGGVDNKRPSQSRDYDKPKQDFSAKKDERSSRGKWSKSASETKNNSEEVVRSTLVPRAPVNGANGADGRHDPRQSGGDRQVVVPSGSAVMSGQDHGVVQGVGGERPGLE